MFFAGLVFAASVVGASAQLNGLSSNCQAGLTSVLTGPAGPCLGVSGLINIAMTPANQSIVTPINNWLASTCSQPACTNDILQTAFVNITNSCSLEVSGAGYDDKSLKEIIDTFKEWYPTGREVACLQDTSASNAYCITTTLRAIETYTGEPLSQTAISTLAPKLAASELPKSLTCTNCIHAAYSIIRPKLDDSSRTSADNYLSSQCGTTYTDGSAPPSIKQSANTAMIGTNGAMSLSASILSSAPTLLVGVAGLAVLAL